MEIYNFPDKLNIDASAVALGDFDGVHIAHQKIIEECVSYSKENGLKSGVLLLKNPYKNGYLTDIEERIEEIEKLCVDFCYVAQIDGEFMKKSPEDFVKFLKENLFAKACFAGFNYRFGYKASADAFDLVNISKKCEIKAFIASEEKINDETVSATFIKNMIKSRDLEKAKVFLGRNYFLSGFVKKGFQNGTTLGFKTANLDFSEKRILLPDGVYAGWAYVGKKKYKAIINIGKNPTFDAQKRTIEAHIEGFSKEIYGEKIKLEFIEFIREEIKFPNVLELKKQIEKDKKSLEKLF